MLEGTPGRTVDAISANTERWRGLRVTFWKSYGPVYLETLDDQEASQFVHYMDTETCLVSKTTGVISRIETGL